MCVGGGGGGGHTHKRVNFKPCPVGGARAATYIVALHTLLMVTVVCERHTHPRVLYRDFSEPLETPMFWQLEYTFRCF